jgi:hypothetical protein
VSGPLSCLTHANYALRTSYPLLDRQHRIVGVLAGAPRENWQAVQIEALDALRLVQSRLELSSQGKKGKRGTFPSLAHGLSFGGGQLVRALLCMLSYSNCDR